VCALNESVVELSPPGLTRRLERRREAVSPGDEEIERPTVPVKLFTLVKVIVDIPVVLISRLVALGLAPMVKSAGRTVTVTTTNLSGWPDTVPVTFTR
jgi:hypothetical protein